MCNQLDPAKAAAQAWLATRPDLPQGRYRHYQGGLFDVVCVALDERTLTSFVVYRSVEHGFVWSRPLREWLQNVAPGVPRYARLEEPEATKKREVADGWEVLGELGVDADLARLGIACVELTDDPDPDTLIDALLLAVDPVLGAPMEQVVDAWRTAIARWTPAERKATMVWATAESRRASGNDVAAAPRPPCVDWLPLLPPMPERISGTWTRVEVGHG